MAAADPRGALSMAFWTENTEREWPLGSSPVGRASAMLASGWSFRSPSSVASLVSVGGGPASSARNVSRQLTAAESLPLRTSSSALRSALALALPSTDNEPLPRPPEPTEALDTLRALRSDSASWRMSWIMVAEEPTRSRVAWVSLSESSSPPAPVRSTGRSNRALT